LRKLVLLAVFMQAANGIRPATAQHDGTRTPRPTVPSSCAVVVRSCGLYLLRPTIKAGFQQDTKGTRPLTCAGNLTVYSHFGPLSLRSLSTLVLFMRTELAKDRSDKGPKWMSRSVLRTEVEKDRTKKGPNWTYILTRKLGLHTSTYKITTFSVGIDLKELGGQMSKCLKFCTWIEWEHVSLSTL